ncbi:MAG: inner membrane CreD family protein [Cyanobacteriota bacterium]
MVKHIIALVFIFISTTIAWFILGAITEHRTYTMDSKLKRVVGELWGTIQQQSAPSIYYLTREEKTIKTTQGSEVVKETQMETIRHNLKLDGSKIKVNIELTPRKKGLLWYPTYKVTFDSNYTVLNTFNEEKELYFEYLFPTVNGVYDNFKLTVDNKNIKDFSPQDGYLTYSSNFKPNETKLISVSYQTQGMNEWWYKFGNDVSQIRNFDLEMTTDFNNIDFPDNSISPTDKKVAGKGWILNWNYSNLISGIQIGMKMPQKLNPGPFISKVTFFAPVSLFLFMFLVFIISTLKNVKIHPMNYFFIAGAFFSFHLLIAYLGDLIDIHLAFLISSIVSITLVISYMRLVVGKKFAFIEVGISQFVYLILFSYAFFFEGYTGLAITICCILTLFIVMQATGKLNWEEVFSKK